jgi:hypothetical protein
MAISMLRDIHAVFRQCPLKYDELLSKDMAVIKLEDLIR